MVRNKLTEAVADAVTKAGFVFQTGFDYRIAPELKQLPAAWLHTPALHKKEGREEGFMVYEVKIELIETYGTGTAADEKEKKWSVLESKASEICAMLGGNDNIQVVTDIALSPAELSLTAKGELSLTLSFKARMPFCNYCGTL